MTNKQQTHYCAWHPEIRKYDHILATIEDRIWANLRWYYSTNTIEQVKSQGWQIKEVYIVDADEFGCYEDYMRKCFPEKLKEDNLTKDKNG